MLKQVKRFLGRFLPYPLVKLPDGYYYWILIEKRNSYIVRKVWSTTGNHGKEIKKLVS